jgi:AraC-like DNA-binding protein
MDAQDLLSDVLDALRIDSSALHVFEFSAPWGVQINDFPQPFSWTVVEGALVLERPLQAPVTFEAGDTFVLPRGTGSGVWRFLSAPGVPAFPAADMWQQGEMPLFTPGTRVGHSHVLRWGGGGRMTRIVSTAFGFEDRGLGPLLAALPDLMVVRAADAGSHFVELLLNFPLRSGAAADTPGFAALATQTARLLLVHVVRSFALSGQRGAGWLAGLAEGGIAQALACVHRAPERDWSVAELAAEVGMSRSSFAERFQAAVGQTPMRYVRAWRVHLACEALATRDVTVTTLAHELGYRSEAAFREAFRQVTGQQPRAYRRAARPLT